MTDKFLLSAFFLLFAPAFAYAAGVSSCKIIKSSSSVKVDLFFDGAFAVKGMVYRDGVLFMPSDGYGDRRYDNIRLLSKSVYQAAEKNALGGACREQVLYRKPELKVLRLTALKSPGRVANVSLTVSGVLNVVAGVIKRKNGGFWVAWPDGFVFARKEDRAYADSLILSRYKRHE
ncbi:MAG: hypothetical protein COT17_04350 [Elusimicrobia bacterium CG08_land_8_20_14_0_20_51_18]|nr:MAG: hypothetical protein COT17_04350 [Elusimicrobia bacterium CG08_land_8_20_14_0_20_51_18]